MLDIKNLSEFVEYSDNNFTKKVIFSTKEQLSFVLNFKQGQSLPTHKHENSTLVLTVLSGTGDIKINDNVQEMEKGTVVMAYGQDDFGIPNVTEDMSVLVTISPNPTNNAYSENIEGQKF